MRMAKYLAMRAVYMRSVSAIVFLFVCIVCRSQSGPYNQEVSVFKVGASGKVGADVINRHGRKDKDEYEKMFFITTDLGKTWRRVDETEVIQDPMQLGHHPADPQTEYRMSGELGRNLFIESSADGGKSWQKLKAGIHGTSMVLRHYAFVRFHPKNPSTFFVAGSVPGSNPDSLPEISGLYVTHNKGATFSLLTANVYPLYCDIALSDPDVIYCTLFRQSLIRSENAGKSWTPMDLRNDSGNTKCQPAGSLQVKNDKRFIHKIMIHPRDPRLVYAYAEDGLWKTNDSGQHWCLLQPTGKSVSINSAVLIASQNEDAIMIGTDIGLFISRDSGRSWSEIMLR